MVAKVRFFAAVILVTFALLCIHLRVTVAAPDADEAMAAALALNEWRVEQGVWPLRMNATLTAMAVDQAEYILSLPEIPSGGAIHTGRAGEDVRQRAQLSTYSWPTYGGADQIAITEIAYVGHSPTAAVSYWNTSSIHHRAALNRAYREVGVAALPHPFGYLYIVVLGARPNVLPALANAKTGVLYLCNEQATQTNGDWIGSVTEFRLFDADGRPLKPGWQAWTPSVTLPAGNGQSVYVEYSDGALQALAEVTMDDTIVPEVVAPVIVVPTETPDPPIPTDLKAEASPTASEAPQASPTENPVEATAIPPRDEASNVALIYDTRSLMVLNLGLTSVNVQDVVFSSGGVLFPVTRWQTQWLSGTLDKLPAGDCLQVWSWSEADVLPQPSLCRQRRGVITVSPQEFFWTQTEFEVRRGDSAIVVCSPAAGRCEFYVP